VTQVNAPARLHRLAEAEQVLRELQTVVEEHEIETDAARGLLDAESADERTDALGELQTEAECVRRDLADLAVLVRLVRVRCLDVDVLDARAAARIVHDLDRVVLVLPRLKTELHEALHGLRAELEIRAQRHDGLKPGDPADEVADVLRDTLDLVDELLVL